MYIQTSITSCSQNGGRAPDKFICVSELALVCGTHIRQAERMFAASYDRRSTVLRGLRMEVMGYREGGTRRRRHDCCVFTGGATL
eukprot:6202807-Pleurochrysis_carterae.AAC.2